jgi:hypothetical protein
METRTLIDAQNARDAADDPTDGAANHGAERTGRTLAFARPALDAARHALRLRHHRHCDNGKKRGSSDQTTIHECLLL